MTYTLNNVHSAIAGKSVYIWGGMIVGQGLGRALERHQLQITGFIDSSRNLQGSNALGYPIISPERFRKRFLSGETIVVIGTGHYEQEIEKICQEWGLAKQHDYLLGSELNDIDPSIDISGVCNLRCISCPRGNLSEQPPVGLMSIDDYQLVLAKLLKEIPFLGSVQLYAWGEPLLNKNLPQIIRLTRDAKVLTALSTNLNATADYEALVRACPDWIKISVSGFGDDYEITHTGGKWPRFLKNLHRLVELKAQYHTDLHIIVNYHLYRHNREDSYANMRALCQDLGLIFRPNIAYLYPMDVVQDYTEGRTISPQAQQTLDLLLLNIDEGLNKAQQLKDLPCPEERCLPINWDRSVRFCGVYFDPFIADDFLTISLDELLAKRKNSQFCGHCMSLGLHQMTKIYVEEWDEYSQERV